MGTNSASPARHRYEALLITLLALFCASVPLRAQSPSVDTASTGKLYLLAFPDTVGTDTDPRFPYTIKDRIALFIYAPVATGCHVTGRGYDHTETLQGGTFTRIELNDSASPAPNIFVDEINTVTNKIFRVETQEPVILYCWMMTRAGGEGWTPVPVDRWGKEYRAAALPGEVVRSQTGTPDPTSIEHVNKPAPAEIVVIASEDNTHVLLRAPVGLHFLSSGHEVAVTLNKGEAYQVQSVVDIGDDADYEPDIAATHIIADKPVGVISGNTRAQINYDEAGGLNNVYKNMLFEWMPPAEQFGVRFVFLPTWDEHRPGSGSQSERSREYVRVYGGCSQINGYYLQPGGSTRVPYKIKADSLSEVQIGEPQAIYFTAGQPAQVMMHSTAIVKFNGSTPCFRGIPCLFFTAFAPYMSEVVPREQWTTFAPYYIPSDLDSMEHFVNVVADTASAHAIYREDGTLFNFNRAIAGTDLIWGTDTAKPGTHWLEGRGGASFYAVAYGLRGGYENYSPGGSRAQLVEQGSLAYGYPLAPERKMLQSACATLGVDDNDLSPLGFSIALDGANPVSGSIEITYRLGTAARTELAVYDVAGKKVATLGEGMMGSGEHRAVWDATAAPSGVYFCRLVAGTWSDAVPVIVRH